MSMALSAFLSDLAGRAFGAISSIAVYNKWGLFYQGGSLQLEHSRPTLFGRSVKALAMNFLPRHDAVFPEGSLDSVSVIESFNLPTAPQEKGEYASYNKSKAPQSWKAVYLVDGKLPTAPLSTLIPDPGGLSALEQRQRFLQKLREVAKSTAFLTLRLPEGEYTVNLTGYELSRDSASIECMAVTLFLQEINPASLSAGGFFQNPVSIGTIVPQEEKLP